MSDSNKKQQWGRWGNKAPKPEMSEEEEIELLEQVRAYDELMESYAALAEAGKAPGIGYGDLYDRKEYDGNYDYMLGMDIAIEDSEGGVEALGTLSDMVERVVKQWLMDFAPKGTHTSLVGIFDD